MALIKCEECGQAISDRAAACPHCGAPVGAPRSKPLAPSRVPGWQKALGGLFLLGVVTSCIVSGKKPADAQGLSDGDAVYLCQQAIKLASKDPERADIPVVPVMQSGDQVNLAWGHSTKMLRLRNGLGLEVAASGSCAVSRSQKRVVSLTLNGETIL